jgi:hypothetical protein
MGSRPGIWAGFFGGLFLAASTMTVTWVAVSQSAAKPLPWWPLWIFVGLGLIGVVGFLLSIYRPHVLPGHKKHLEELESHRKEEVALAARRARAAGNVGMTGPINSESISRRQTDAMNRLASAMERQEQRQSDSSDGSSDGST